MKCVITRIFKRSWGKKKRTKRVFNTTTNRSTSRVRPAAVSLGFCAELRTPTLPPPSSPRPTGPPHPTVSCTWGNFIRFPLGIRFPPSPARTPSPVPCSCCVPPRAHSSAPGTGHQQRGDPEGGSPARPRAKPFFNFNLIQHHVKLPNAASVAGSERCPEGFAAAGLSLLQEGISSVLNLVQFQPYFSTPDR